VHAGKNDHVGVRLGGRLRQAEGVADKVGDVLDIRLLVQVRQDNGVLFFFEFFDLGKKIQRRVDRCVDKSFL
jgi:hypothetical protein